MPGEPAAAKLVETGDPAFMEPDAPVSSAPPPAETRSEDVVDAGVLPSPGPLSERAPGWSGAGAPLTGAPGVRADVLSGHGGGRNVRAGA